MFKWLLASSFVALVGVLSTVSAAIDNNNPPTAAISFISSGRAPSFAPISPRSGLHRYLSSNTSNATSTPTAQPTTSIPAPTTQPTVGTVAPTATQTPTSVPTAKPSFAPQHSPTIAPSSMVGNHTNSTSTLAPTTQPTVGTVAPTAAPTAKPTPTSAPTAKPTTGTPAPTTKPTGTTIKPTLRPTVKPTIASTLPPTHPPTIVATSPPSLKPTIAATEKPTLQPTIAATAPPSASLEAPLAAPSLAPTTLDTVAVSATMTMDGLDASAVTDDDLVAIKVGLAKVIDNVNASHISDVSVTDASTRRGRALLGTAATVSFTVQVSLAETTFTDASDLQNTVSSTLTSVESESSTLIAKIKAAAASTSKWDAVTGVSDATTAIVTRSPTSVPTAVPTSSPSALPTVADNDSGSSTTVSLAILIGLVVAGVTVFFLVAGLAWNYNKTKWARKGKNYSMSEELGTGLDVESFGTQQMALIEQETPSINLKSDEGVESPSTDLEPSGSQAPDEGLKSESPSTGLESSGSQVTDKDGDPGWANERAGRLPQTMPAVSEETLALGHGGNTEHQL